MSHEEKPVEPNEITYAALEAYEEHKDVYGPFNTVDEMMAELQSDNAQEN